MRPYQTSITLKQNRQTVINENIELTYSYTIGSYGNEFPERTSQRKLRIIDPSSYTGQCENEICQYDTTDCFIINGQLEKCDGNFLSNFTLSKIADTNIWVGPHM
jgi:hypothetical protein